MVSDDRIFGSAHCHLNACIKSNLCGYFIPQTINLQSSIIVTTNLACYYATKKRKAGQGEEKSVYEKANTHCVFCTQATSVGPTPALRG